MKDKRTVRVILKDQAKIEFEKLNEIVNRQQIRGETNSEEIQLLKSIKQKIELIKIKPEFGEKIARKKIPRNMNVSNLFRISITKYWRMVYTLNGNQIEVIAFILYIVDHPTYDKIFGYRKR